MNLLFRLHTASHNGIRPRMTLQSFLRSLSLTGWLRSACTAMTLITCIFLANTQGSAGATNRISDDLLFYHPFDGVEVPVYARGALQIGVVADTFTDGIVQQALRLEGSDARAEFSASANIERPMGTLSFWVRPGWDLPDRDAKNFSFFADENFRVSYLAEQRLLTFMTGKRIPEVGFRWDYGTSSPVIRNWTPGEWYNIVVTWNAHTGEKGMYVNGQEVVRHQTEYLRLDSNRGSGHLSSYFRLGGPGQATDYDELMIWRRILSADEIREIYNDPGAVAEDIQWRLDRAAISERQATPPLQWQIVPEPDPAVLLAEPGETFTAVLPVRNASGRRFAGEIAFRLYDYREVLLDEVIEEVTLEPGEAHTFERNYTLNLQGPFKIGIAYFHEGGAVERDVYSFAVWPKPDPDRAKDDSFFGSHINSFTEERVAFAARLGETWQRNHNMLTTTWWPRVEPEPGIWEPFDEHMLDHHVKYGIDVLGQFFGTPYWAIASGDKRPPQPAGTQYPANYPYGDPPDLEAFGNYVERVVSEYKHIIRYWETWNEPDVSLFWRGTPAQFAELAKVAYTAAKRADPDAIIVLGGFTVSAWGWHQQAAEAGAFHHADAIGFHFGTRSTPPEVTERSLERTINHFQGLAIDYGPGHELPLWSTEGGTINTTWLRGLDYDFLPPENVREPLDWKIPMIRIVQSSVILQRHGIVKHFYYFQNPIRPIVPGVFRSTSLFEVNFAPRPAWIARLNLAQQVNGLDYAERVLRRGVRLWANLYSDPDSDKVVAVVWVGDEGEVVLADGQIPAGFTGAYDLMGNAIDEKDALIIRGEPSYVHFSGDLDGIKNFFETAKLAILQQPLSLEVPQESTGLVIPELPDYVAVEEVPGRDFIVDLSSVANMGLADEVPGDNQGGWLDQGSLNDARDLPLGEQTHYAVPLKILDPNENDGRSVVVLRGTALTPGFPVRSGEIRIGDGDERIRALYFLHSVGWVVRPQVVGHYLVRYESGRILEVPIDSSRNVGDWWHPYDDSEEARPVPFRAQQTPTGEPAWRYLRLWEWQNPTPEDPIVSVEMVSAETATTPILIAITAVRVP